MDRVQIHELHLPLSLVKTGVASMQLIGSVVLYQGIIQTTDRQAAPGDAVCVPADHSRYKVRVMDVMRQVVVTQDDIGQIAAAVGYPQGLDTSAKR
jgi:hypothetical protein